MTPNSLNELEQDIRRDLALIGYPEQSWVPPTLARGGPVLDVLIVGAGQGGLALAAQLLRERVTNIRVIDARPRGEEGIWKRFARMHTLRTPKAIGGPDLGIPSLTFQAWFEAQFGTEAFARIKYIPKEQWQAYLDWFRHILGLPVRNGVRFCGVREGEDGLLEVSLESGGEASTILVRKLALAGGIETSGYWWMPPEIAALPRELRAHAADDIDFEALRGKRVAVIGAGASAFDNAATALEHGAAEVVMLCRRPDLQRIQPYKVLAYAGFLRHFGSLPDADRWRVMNYVLTIREALTSETWARVTIHENFRLLTGAPVREAAALQGGVVLTTPSGEIEADFVICGTGFETDLSARPELAAAVPHVATWRDRYTPPEGERNARLGRYPYLDAGMAFTEKEPGAAPWVRNITCFNFGATLSFGPSGSSISAMKFAVPRAAHAIAAGLFQADLARHEAALHAYDTPEFPLVFARDART
jgi:cation diffusion facilitator CzcD-associated flavoprotein CzcO